MFMPKFEPEFSIKDTISSTSFDLGIFIGFQAPSTTSFVPKAKKMEVPLVNSIATRGSIMTLPLKLGGCWYDGT